MERDAMLHDLMVEYGQDVWNFAYSLTRRPEMADDVSQDVFIRAYQKLDTFRGESSVKTWLLSITRNVAYDYRRSAFLRRVTLVAFITERETHPSAEREGLDNMVTEGVWKQVLSLSTKLREVLVLYAHHQLTIREIADLLGISEGTVKSRLHRARTKVSSLLKESDQDDPATAT